MELLGDRVMWNLISFCLETVLVSCMIGARFASNVPLAQKIVLDAPDGSPTLRGSSESLVYL
jgi:hypothetical protein